MIRLITLLAIFAHVVNLLAQDPAPATVEAPNAIRQSMNAAKIVNVSEGLPHQMFERELLATESKRKDTEKIGSFHFYSPAVAATNSDVLKSILVSSETIQTFGGEKKCGGFHPDFAVRWQDGKGAESWAQICFNCHEIIYSDGKHQYRYDFEDAPFEKLKKALEPYAKKRPRQKD